MLTHLLQSNAIGVFPELDDTAFVHLVNHRLATRSMPPLPEALRDAPSTPRLDLLRKATCNPRPSPRYHRLPEDASQTRRLFFRAAHFCPMEDQRGLPIRTVGLFNLAEEPCVAAFTAAEIGLPDTRACHWTDVWTGEEGTLDGAFQTTLPPHGSRLLAINEDAPAQLLDADARVRAAALDGKRLTLLFDDACTASLTFRTPPRALAINATPCALPCDERFLQIRLPAHATLAADF